MQRLLADENFNNQYLTLGRSYVQLKACYEFALRFRRLLIGVVWGTFLMRDVTLGSLPGCLIPLAPKASKQ